jgi:hypothetical protein
MSSRRLAVVVALVGLPLPLPSSPAAQSSPSPALSLPGIGVSLPEVGVSLPSVGVSLPGASVSTPGVSVTTPSVGVSVPSVGVSVPSVGVSTPGVSASTPGVTVTTPTVTTGTTGSGGSGGGGSQAGGAPTSPEQTHSSGGGSGGGVVYSHDAGASTGSDSQAQGTASTGGGSVTSTAGGATNAGGPGSTTSRARGRAERRHAAASGHAGATALGGPAVGASVPGAPPAARGAGTTEPHASATASNPLEALGKHIPLPLPVPDWSKPIILALLALAIWFAVRAHLSARRARRLERQRTTLLRDVGAMQAALVPVIPPRVGGLAVSVGYRPAEGPAAGGDFYDVFVPERGTVAVILGDVAGHGPRALSQAALIRYTLRAYLQAGLEPRAALALAGRVLADPTAERLATVVVGVYHVRDGCLTYASAGHPPPILHGLHTREPLAVCASPPVGWRVPTGRRQTTVSLPRGAVACFFSDGLLEARCKQDMLGRERLSELLGALGSRPDATKLLARVRAAAVATPDDMAACILVPETAVVGVDVHIEELELDAGALENGQARCFLETCQVPALEIEQTLARAGDMVRDRGAALLRADIASGSAAASVEVPAAPPQVAVADGGPQPVGA